MRRILKVLWCSARDHERLPYRLLVRTTTVRVSPADTETVPRYHRLLNSRDIATLNRAREVLRRLEETAWTSSFEHFDPYAAVTGCDLGRLSEAANVADDAIFRVLNTARNSCHMRITDDQLFPSPAYRPKAEKAPEARSSPSASTPTIARAAVSSPRSRASARRNRGS